MTIIVIMILENSINKMKKIIKAISAFAALCAIATITAGCTQKAGETATEAGESTIAAGSIVYFNLDRVLEERVPPEVPERQAHGLVRSPRGLFGDGVIGE